MLRTGGALVYCERISQKCLLHNLMNTTDFFIEIGIPIRIKFTQSRSMVVQPGSTSQAGRPNGFENRWILRSNFSRNLSEWKYKWSSRECSIFDLLMACDEFVEFAGSTGFSHSMHCSLSVELSNVHNFWWHYASPKAPNAFWAVPW